MMLGRIAKPRPSAASACRALCEPMSNRSYRACRRCADDPSPAGPLGLVLPADQGDLQATPTVELLQSSGVINRGLMAQAPSGGKPVSLTSLPAEQLMSIREQARFLL